MQREQIARVIRRWSRGLLPAVGLAILAAWPLPAPGDTPTATVDKTAETPADSMALSGGSEGTVFGSLTIQGENRIQVEFQRPDLEVSIDPRQAPGLDWGTAMDVLDRSIPDLTTPLLSSTRGHLPRRMPRLWLTELRSGPVARFHPDMEEVASWRLVVVDSRGREVVEFSGRDHPPGELTWDGSTQDDSFALPGITYSYVFEAQDRAGNRRRLVGEGFQVPPYQVESGPELVILVPGDRVSAATAPCLEEVADRLNLICDPLAPVVLRATARSFDEADALAERVRARLSPRLLGNPARLKVETQVEPGLAPGGSVVIAGRRR
jgi:hypothetical protein